MMEYLIAFGFFIIAIGLMFFALQFSQYKRRPSGCCGGGHCAENDENEGLQHSCYDDKVNFVKEYKIKSMPKS